MLTDLFTHLEWFLSQNTGVVLAASFGWGIGSILLSPCHLSGIPVAILALQRNSKSTALVPILFGFGTILSLVFIGIATFLLGLAVVAFSIPSNWVLAAVFLISGLLMLDIFALDFVPNYIRPNSSRPGIPIMVGLFFGFFVGPCTLAFAMPIISASGIAVGKTGAAGLLILFFFAAGHLIATFLLGTSMQRTTAWLTRLKALHRFKAGIGYCLVALGIISIYFAARGV